jgi:hypothetical protein
MDKELSHLSIQKTVNGFSRQSLYLGTALNSKKTADASTDHICGYMIDIRETSILYAIELLYVEAEFRGNAILRLNNRADNRTSTIKVNRSRYIDSVSRRSDSDEWTGSLNATTRRRLYGVNNAVYVKQFMSTA